MGNDHGVPAKGPREQAGLLLSRWSADPAVVIDTVDESFRRLIALFDAPDQIQVRLDERARRRKADEDGPGGNEA